MIRAPEYGPAPRPVVVAADDRAWSKAVLTRDGYTCLAQFKGCSIRATEAHHVFARAFVKLRLLVLNGISLCHECHEWVENNPVRARDELAKAVGVEWIEKLRGMFEKLYGYKIDQKIEDRRGRHETD